VFIATALPPTVAGHRAAAPNHPSPIGEEERTREERKGEERERVSQNERKIGLHPIYTLIQTGSVLFEPTQPIHQGPTRLLHPFSPIPFIHFLHP